MFICSICSICICIYIYLMFIFRCIGLLGGSFKNFDWGKYDGEGLLGRG